MLKPHIVKRISLTTKLEVESRAVHGRRSKDRYCCWLEKKLNSDRICKEKKTDFIAVQNDVRAVKENRYLMWSTDLDDGEISQF